MSGSWIDVAADSDFSIGNIPFGVFSNGAEPRIGTRVGDFVLDLKALVANGLFAGLGFDTSVLTDSTLNRFMGLTRAVWRSVRDRIIELVSVSGNPALKDDAALRARAMMPVSAVQMHMPAAIGDYTDFYSSREHATNVGIMFRGVDNALQPNWLHLPVGYHGRSSSVVISGTPVVRPRGQLQVDKADPKKGSSYGDCRLMDFELEMAFFVGGPPNPMGRPLTMEEADERIFGLVLMNDWSARDIQAWEYVPLGPFTAKNFATSISPWIVTLDALEGFRCSSSAGPVQSDPNPNPLPYINDPQYATGAFDITLEVSVRPEGESPSKITTSNLRNMYWNIRQQLVHHSVTGCPMLPGDLLGTGTISGSSEDSYGSMLELSWRGSKDIVLENSASQTRKFLKDGDDVIMTGFSSNGDKPRVGFGEVSGKVLPAGSPAPSTSLPASAAVTYRLHGYWQSTCSWRVRIALMTKGLAFEYIPVDLSVMRGNNVARLPPSFKDTNFLEQLPVLEVITTQPDGSTKSELLTQSIAIMEYLDEVYPDRALLLPKDPLQRARSRQVAEIINSGIQPLQNIGLLRQIKVLELTPEKPEDTPVNVDGKEFAGIKIQKGLEALEALVSTLVTKDTGLFAAGTLEPTIADFALIPQIFNGRKFGCDLSKIPTLLAVEERCNKLPQFANAHALKQPDAPPA